MLTRKKGPARRRIIGMWLAPADFALAEQVALRRGVSLAALVREIALPIILDLAAQQTPISAPGLAAFIQQSGETDLKGGRGEDHPSPALR